MGFLRSSQVASKRHASTPGGLVHLRAEPKAGVEGGVPSSGRAGWMVSERGARGKSWPRFKRSTYKTIASCSPIGSLGSLFNHKL